MDIDMIKMKKKSGSRPPPAYVEVFVCTGIKKKKKDTS